MNVKRTGVMLKREILQGNKGFLLIMAIVAPVIMSVVVSLVFGTLLSTTPHLGILDEGDSRMVAMANEYSSMITTEYSTDAELRQAVESGDASLGLILPPDFDRAVTEATETDLTIYIWGEGRSEHFEILVINIDNIILELSGVEAPVNIETIPLGSGTGIPWNERLLPFIVLYTIILAAVILPAMAVVTEKEKKTITALVASPATLGEIFFSKGVVGAVLSLFMGVVVLLINQAFGVQPWLLVLVLGLGAVMASIIGLIAGAFLKDVTSLFALSKIAGILLSGPGLVYMFPQIPQWIGRIFPTYYMIEPIVELVHRGGGWNDIVVNVFIMAGLIVFLSIILSVVLRKRAEQQVAL